MKQYKQYAIQFKDEEKIYDVIFLGEDNGFWIFQSLDSEARIVARPSDVHVFPCVTE